MRMSRARSMRPLAKPECRTAVSHPGSTMHRCVARAAAFVAMGSLAVSLSVAASMGVAAEGQAVRSSARSIPVCAKVDLVVVGGNEGGIAAAWAAAESGSSVLLVNGNYFFSDDVAAKARYWLEKDEIPQGQFAKSLVEGITSGKSSEIVPAIYKRRIEQLLLDAGVRFQFNSRPVGLLVDGAGDAAGVVVANKAGLQAVVAKMVIDATPTAALARMAGAETTPWPDEQVTVSRTFYGGDVPHACVRGNFRELSLEVSMPQGSWPERCRAEVALREAYNRVDARRAHAHTMHMIEPVSIVSISEQEDASWKGGDSLDISRGCPKGVANVYVVSQAADVPRGWAEKLTRPVHLADWGERVGHAAHQAAAARNMPSDVSVKTMPDAAAILGLDVAELLDGCRAYSTTDLGTVPQAETAVPVWASYDVIVVGGGTAGMPAAMGAANHGAKVLVIEMFGLIGGNRELGTASYWKGYPYGYNQFGSVASKWRAADAFEAARKAGVDIWYNTFACGAVKEKTRVCGVVVATPMGRGAVLGKVIIDATGDADVCVAAGAEYHYLNDGDLCLQEASYRGIKGLYGNVLPIDHLDVYSSTMHHVLARNAGPYDVWDYYPMAAIRETRLIKGDYVINVIDQIIGRTYRDLVGVSWSAYDPHGYHNSDFIYAGLMPPTKHETKPGFATYFPLRSMLPAGLEGIMVAGRSHSVTHDVQASVRMNPDLINFGYAAGCVAAHAIGTNTTLREAELAPVQDHLAEIGNMSEEDRATRCVDVPSPTDEELKTAAADPNTKLQMATLLRAEGRSLPYVQASFARKPTLVKAKLLCMLDDPTAVPYLCEWLDQHPLGEGQAYAWDAFLSVSDVESVIWLLGRTRDTRAVPALLRKLDQCGTDGTSFSQIRALTTALGRIGSPDAAAPLSQFLAKPGVQGHVDVAGKPESLRAESFVRSYVELHVAAALMRCGDQADLARTTLRGYLDDWRGIFVRYAGHVLQETAP